MDLKPFLAVLWHCGVLTVATAFVLTEDPSVTGALIEARPDQRRFPGDCTAADMIKDDWRF